MITLTKKLLGGLTPYVTSILVGLLMAAGAGTYWIYSDLLETQQEVQEARSEALGYLALAGVHEANLEAARALHAATLTSLTARAEAAERLNKQHKERSDDLNKALAAEPDWSRTVIPDGVRQSLARP